MRLAKRLWALINRNAADRAMERELASHLSLLEEELEHRGMDSATAKIEARRRFGNADQARELHRDARSFVWLEQAWQDLRHAARSLTRNPGFAALSVLTLALGIGVNTTLFSAYNALALKPLPVADPHEIVRVKRWFQSGARGDSQFAFSCPEYQYSRDRTSQFSSVIATSWPVSVTTTGPEKLNGQLVSSNYFTALGIQMRLGRGFIEHEDDAAGAVPVIVLSHAFWNRRFQADAAILGQPLQLNGKRFVVAGVASEEFTGTSIVPMTPDFWVPLSQQKVLLPASDWLNSPEDARVQLLARLKPGARLASAQSEIDGLIRQFDDGLHLADKTSSVTVQHTNFLAEADDIRFQAAVAGLGLVVGLVLLVACANIANMLLARGLARHREIAARLMLGASRARVVRHLLTESLLLSLIGAAGGLLFSIWASRLLWLKISEAVISLGGSALPPLSVSPDLRVIAYALGLSIAAGIFFGLSPALQSTRMDLSSAIKDEGSVLGQRSMFRSFLIGAQVTASMILLICASFLTRGLMRSEMADTGFESKHLLVLAGEFGADPVSALAHQQQILDSVRLVPQVESAALGGIPMTGTWTPPMIAGEARGRTLASYATAGYHETLGVPLVRGHAFDAADSARPPGSKDSSRHAIVSESAARRFWAGEDPIGKLFKLDLDFRGNYVDFEVIGVAKDVRYANLSRVDPSHVYLAGFNRSAAEILIRVGGDPAVAAASIRTKLAKLTNAVEMQLNVFSFERGPLQAQKSMARALGTFALLLAALAVSLAAIGIYGITNYLVRQRTKEIGIRFALGASKSSVLQAAVYGSLQPVGAGLVLGTICAAAGSYGVHATLEFPGSNDFFYGLPFYDPFTLVGAAALFLSVAALASAAPARQALRVDPIISLRYE